MGVCFVLDEFISWKNDGVIATNGFFSVCFELCNYKGENLKARMTHNLERIFVLMIQYLTYKLNITNTDRQNTVFMKYVCRAVASRVNGGRMYLSTGQRS